MNDYSDSIILLSYYTVSKHGKHYLEKTDYDNNLNVVEVDIRTLNFYSFHFI